MKIESMKVASKIATSPAQVNLSIATLYSIWQII